MQKAQGSPLSVRKPPARALPSVVPTYTAKGICCCCCCELPPATTRLMLPAVQRRRKRRRRAVNPPAARRRCQMPGMASLLRRGWAGTGRFRLAWLGLARESRLGAHSRVERENKSQLLHPADSSDFFLRRSQIWQGSGRRCVANSGALARGQPAHPPPGVSCCCLQLGGGSSYFGAFALLPQKKVDGREGGRGGGEEEPPQRRLLARSLARAALRRLLPKAAHFFPKGDSWCWRAPSPRARREGKDGGQAGTRVRARAPAFIPRPGGARPEPSPSCPASKSAPRILLAGSADEQLRCGGGGGGGSSL